jgi:DNA-directed RNA polymerase specialized sigma24 family protein
MEPLQPDAEPKSMLDQISTRWSQISDPVQFVLRYAPAIQKYLEALIKDPHDAEEVAQDFLLTGLQRGFLRTDDLRGRFRDYLKAGVRNAALMHFRRRKAARRGGPDPAYLPARGEARARAEAEWVAGWRRCVLDRAWQALEHHQGRSPGNLCYTVLRLAAEHPDEDSAALAARAAALAGRPLRADAFRKQLSRARRLFAEFVQQEVAQTLDETAPEALEDELRELGLLAYVRPYLPAGGPSDPE